MKHSLALPAVLAAAFALQTFLPSCASARGPEGAKAAPEGEPAMREADSPGMLPEKFAEKLSERLGLTADQKRKVEAVLEKSRPEMEKLRVEMKALHEKMREAMLKTKEAIREGLTLEQKGKFDEMMARMRGRMMGPPKDVDSRRWKRGEGKPGMKGAPREPGSGWRRAGPSSDGAPGGSEKGEPPENEDSDD